MPIFDLRGEDEGRDFVFHPSFVPPFPHAVQFSRRFCVSFDVDLKPRFLATWLLRTLVRSHIDSENYVFGPFFLVHREVVGRRDCQANFAQASMRVFFKRSDSTRAFFRRAGIHAFAYNAVAKAVRE